MRAGIAGVCGVPVRTKTFAVKSVRAIAAGIVASAEADADLLLRAPRTGARPFLRNPKIRNAGHALQIITPALFGIAVLPS